MPTPSIGVPFSLRLLRELLVGLRCLPLYRAAARGCLLTFAPTPIVEARGPEAWREAKVERLARAILRGPYLLKVPSQHDVEGNI
eukprot:scaffold1414_cov384-Prasinococcus_capsulatus_cf.AAC.4